jgi:Ser/Thr protein kinase RdoA (MazF antagonist)
MTDTQLRQLLQRTNFTLPVDQLFKHIARTYPISDVVDIEPIVEGYEDANIILTTSAGKYVLKLFSLDRSIENIRSYVRVLSEAAEIGVPVTKLVEGEAGALGLLKNGDDATYCILTEFFEGTNFQNVVPSMQDIVQVTEYVSKLNQLIFPVTECYDSWGNKNLVTEFEKHKQSLSKGVRNKVESIVDECRLVEASRLSRAVIHGDMQRKHVLKRGVGEYCILDFGCMSCDAKVYELSTYLAWFCLAPNTWDMHREITDAVVSVYQNTHHLNPYELSLLKSLTRASYASYYMTTSLMIESGDKGRETAEWHNLAKLMLDKTSEW